MALVNEHFLKLASNYLFADIAKKVNAYKIAHPKQRVIILELWYKDNILFPTNDTKFYFSSLSAPLLTHSHDLL